MKARRTFAERVAERKALLRDRLNRPFTLTETEAEKQDRAAGEIRSYVGVVKAASGTLLGGVHVHLSSRFATALAAQNWLDTVERANREAGRAVGESRVLPSRLAPQIEG